MQDNDIDGSGKAASAGVTAPQTVADVLDAAADLVAKLKGWTQGAYARDADGRDVNPYEKWRASPQAVCFCLYGALAQVASQAGMEKIPSLTDPLPSTEWNDAPGRTQSEVVAALRAAATSARQGETE